MDLTDKQIARYLSLAGKVTSILFVIVIAMFYIGEGIQHDFEKLRNEELIMMLFFPVGIIIGYVVSWFKKITGTIITVLSILVFYLIDYLISGTIPKGIYFIIFLVPTIFFFLSYIKSPKPAHKQ